MQIQGSHVLITGGTGSFGHRVAVRLLEHSPSQITIFSRDEKKQHEMARRYPDFRYVLGDVRDYDSVHDALHRVDIVFHAAALKQVPHCEMWPMQAVATNVLGSTNLCRASIARGVRSVVALSTDKAVEPVNAMGMTKALMEKVVTHYGSLQSDTNFSCVRYGNVMGSRGSVIPVFRQQIRSGGPLTLTVPHMTRFLLTLDEAVGLVFYAMENATGGEVFVRKAPACTVEMLAEAMIQRYAGGKRIPTVVVGMRVGEKIHEVLLNEYEMLRAVDREEYFVVPPAQDGHQVEFSPGEGNFSEYTSANTRQITEVEEILRLLMEVDEYTEANP